MKLLHFGYTAEDENNCIGDLFSFCGIQFLALVSFITSYGHRLSINT